MTDLIDQAREWISGDPDPDTRARLQAEVDAGDLEALRLSVGATLTFGTAGIRGEVGPGSNRMNRAMVIKTTAGLAAHLKEDGRAGKVVVVGFDARPSSRTFAEDAAGVLAAAGIDVVYFPEVTPTPVVAFAAKHLDAGAAVVITASHNPPADNGYKVYGGNAAQIIPPEDEQIAAGIASSGPANRVSRQLDVFSGGSARVNTVPGDVVERYFEEVDGTRPSPQQSSLTFVYTPLHGVGGEVVDRLFRRAGHTGLRMVTEQSAPDGRFPTVRFPNPEEEGALDLALAMARAEEAAAVLANDPDADRLAAAVPTVSSAGGAEWRLLTGNELGALLGDFVLRNWRSEQRPIVVNSIVSSPMLARIARAHGARHEVTLTGFKWIVDAGLTLERSGEGRFAFGYEEALGYTIGRTVRDKDGISAALVLADLIAEETKAGRTLLDRLVDIWQTSGIWVSAQLSIVRGGVSGGEAIQAAVARLADSPPQQVGGFEVAEVTDFRKGGEDRPPWLGAQDLVSIDLGDPGRLLVRPSGTEPKLKIYSDLVQAAGAEPHDQQRRLLALARATVETMGEWLDL